MKKLFQKLLQRLSGRAADSSASRNETEETTVTLFASDDCFERVSKILRCARVNDYAGLAPRLAEPVEVYRRLDTARRDALPTDDKTDAREVTLLMQSLEAAKTLLSEANRACADPDKLQERIGQWLMEEWQPAVARNGFAPTAGGPFCPRAKMNEQPCHEETPGRENPGVTLHVWTTKGDAPHLSNYFVVLDGVVIASNLGYRVGQSYKEADTDMLSVMKHPCSEEGDNVYPGHVQFDLRYWLPRRR